MTFKLRSFNVRGLNDPSVERLLKHYVDSIPRLEGLFLQEHKFRRQENLDLDRYL